MKNKILVSLFGLFTLLMAGCDANSHEHTFSEEWSSDALSHWHEATCEHKELSSFRAAHTDSNEDGFCDVCHYEVGHEHTFSNEWVKTETHHWHTATCSHEDEISNYGKHSFNIEGVCTVCGYVAPNLYPVITKLNQNGYIIENTWADDLSYVTSKQGNDPLLYFGLDKEGRLISEGDLVSGTPIIKTSYIYEDELITSKIIFNDDTGEMESKEIYAYNDENKLVSYKWFDVNEGVETLWKEEKYQYYDTYWTRTVTKDDDNDGTLEFNVLDKWTITTEEENTKHTLERRHEENGPFTLIGYLVYNKLGQIIEKKDLCYSSFGNYYSYRHVTYTEDGALSSVIEHNEGEKGHKLVNSYNQDGFIVSKKMFNFNDGSQDYDILTGGYDYTVDSKGTVTKIVNYTIEGGQRVDGLSFEFEVMYIPVETEIEYMYFNAETKGTYDSQEIKLLGILG